jgi:hypothetical protein
MLNILGISLTGSLQESAVLMWSVDRTRSLSGLLLAELDVVDALAVCDGRLHDRLFLAPE